jgi:co-chaperonin GroES (HSP10)
MLAARRVLQASIYMKTWLIAALLVRPAPAIQPSGSEPPRKADSVIGEVTTLDLSSRRLTVKTGPGTPVEVRADEKTVFLKARPGSSTLDDATPARLEELAVGDRVLARGRLAEDKASLAARQVVVMTRGDISAKQDAERAQWRRRGILGVVSAVDPARGEITLQARRPAGTQPIVIAAGEDVRFRRYASDSVKFSDARPSVLDDVRVGDQLRALGDRSEDGSRFVPEQIVFGTFRTVAGTVAQVDPAGGELTVRDEESGKPVRVAVGADARLRRIPAELGARTGRWGEGPGTGGGPGGGPEDLLERLPSTTLAEVKVGDRVLVSSTKGSDPSRINAIALVAGLEALAGSRMAGGRGARGGDTELPPDLMDLGISIP